MHALWTLPPGDGDFSGRWKAIKIACAKSEPKLEALWPVRTAKRERGIWQRRFWEHTIRDEFDYAAHIEYVHFNPIKHGMVERVTDWPYSSFHRWGERGVYALDWAGEEVTEMSAGERGG